MREVKPTNFKKLRNSFMIIIMLLRVSLQGRPWSWKKKRTVIFLFPPGLVVWTNDQREHRKNKKEKKPFRERPWMPDYPVYLFFFFFFDISLLLLFAILCRILLIITPNHFASPPGGWEMCENFPITFLLFETEKKGKIDEKK